MERAAAERDRKREMGKVAEVKAVFRNWLVVTGTMEFYDFPFSWE